MLNFFVSGRSKASEQLLSADTHSNTANFKYTFSVEIAPICKDDLVCIPPKQARSLGNISPLTVCTRVGNSIHLLDPQTLQFCDITAPVYWRTPFFSLASVTDLVEFTVLDIEPSGPTKGKWVLADAQVALSGAFRSSGNNGDDVEMDYELASSANQIFHTRTHLGAILQPGDSVMGYSLTGANFNSDDFAQLPTHRIPDIILVKKAYPNRRKKSKARNWQLRSIAKEAGEEGETSGARGIVGRMGGRDRKKVEQDYELFLRDLEEDLEMRGAVNLYKIKKDEVAETTEIAARLAGGKQRAKGQLDSDVQMTDSAQEDGDEGEGDFPEVRLEELLEEFDEMTLQDDGIQPYSV
jgi:nonsense-mediated mRNA decay protein 3